MDKYIDCEAAYRFAQDQIKKETGAYSKGWNNALGVMKGALHNNDAIQAADVVPVVRCGECKHRHDDNFCGGRGWPEQLVPDDGYCDCGARREGDGNE